MGVLVQIWETHPLHQLLNTFTPAELPFLAADVDAVPKPSNPASLHSNARRLDLVHEFLDPHAWHSALTEPGGSQGVTDLALKLHGEGKEPTCGKRPENLLFL